MKQKRKLPPAAPEGVGKTSSEPSVKRKKKQGSAGAVVAVPPINEDKMTSDSCEVLVPLGYYPSELGYADSGAASHSKGAGRKSQKAKKVPSKSQDGSTSVSRVRTSPRVHVCLSCHVLVLLYTNSYGSYSEIDFISLSHIIHTHTHTHTHQLACKQKNRSKDLIPVKKQRKK